jgi:hypothetical protein
MEPKGKDHQKIADQWLDGALKQYGDAKPRTGLEGRVLANLRAERDHQTAPRNWWPALAAVAAIVVAGAAIFSLRTHNFAKRIVVAKHEVRAVTDASGLTTSGQKPVVATAAAARSRALARTSRLVHVVETTSEPRLAQFPSARPLSEQEVILANYVAHYQDKAVLLARAQAKLREREDREFQQPLRDQSLPDSE